MKKAFVARFMKSKLFSFKPKLIHLTILIIALALVVVFLHSRINILNKQEKVSESTATITPTLTPAPTIDINQSMIDSKQILVNLEKNLNVTSEITERNNDWYVENKERIPLMGQEFALGKTATLHVGKYGNYNSSSEVTEASLKPLQNEVDKFFISNDFQKDNNSTFRKSDLKYSYLALFMGYKKGNIKCLVTLYPQGSTFVHFFCGIVDQTQLEWRKELATAVNTNNDPNIVFQVYKLIGNYARGNVGGLTGGGGTGWYAVKINGQWKIVAKAQQMMLDLCKSLVLQYNIPKEILECAIPTTPTPAQEKYYRMEMPLCRTTISTQVETKDCLLNKFSEIIKAGQECDKAHGIEIKCTTKDSFENLKSCLDQCKDSSDKQTCVNNCPKIDCSQARTDYETLRQKYLDLISKYCKDI